MWPLNIAIENNYHTYNSFIKVYYVSRPVIMSSFHLALPKLYGNFAMFSSLSEGELPFTNNLILVIGQINSCNSATTASPSLRLIIHTSSILREIGKLFRL